MLTLAIVTVCLLTVTVGLLLWLLLRPQTALLAGIESSRERNERSVREEFGRNREESSASARELREELTAAVQKFGDLVLTRMAEGTQLQQTHWEASARQLAALASGNEEKLEAIRTTVARNLGELKTGAEQQHGAAREELARSMKAFSDSLLGRMAEIATLQKQQLETFATNFTTLSQSNEQRLEAMRATVERKLGEMQQDNTLKLDQMRATVDEKLHATLEQRLGESFKLVSERLEQVHSGLGEMRTLATGVGDLKKVLTNIKTRGCWGEVQLGNLLEQMLTPDQFDRNVAVNPGSSERVEYAVKLPGKEVDGAPVWLPIDAKFPQEEYQRLVDAQERGDAEAAENASAALETSVKAEAKKICAKYVTPPHTTDFAIMFLPTEGLFAEVLRRPGLCDGILGNHRVVLSGPTTLAAVLSSLQMGFRTLSIAKRSSEVWNVLGAVKTEFGKFGASLEKVKKKLHEATNSIDDAARRSRAVQRKLQGAEEMPLPDAAKLVGAESLLPELGLGEDESER
ncbi:MAG TPA: DNA recombination protein RmuC [Chthoniobacteraceae bacterium]|jgi:DNA recombination protein RmuC|nr:RmuC family protein [Chthoniobacter sp.]HEV7868635.1 DNA recombination protein RmuC [Chthoniobacteraceae bacterium]